MSFLSPKKPQVVQPTPAPPTPTVDTTEVQNAAANERKRRVAMGGRASTILNDGSSATAAATMLLGQ